MTLMTPMAWWLEVISGIPAKNLTPISATRRLFANVASAIGSGTRRMSDCKIAWAENERSRGISSNSKPIFDFEPHPLLIDESNLAEGSIADEGGKMKNVVEPLLAGSSKNSKAMETFETGNFVFWQRRPH
jgi:hypothetical protein